MDVERGKTGRVVDRVVRPDSLCPANDNDKLDVMMGYD